MLQICLDADLLLFCTCKLSTTLIYNEQFTLENGTVKVIHITV